MTQCINKVYVMLRAVYISLDSLNDHNVVMVYKSRGIDICEKYKIYTAELIFFVLPLVFLVAAMQKDYWVFVGFRANRTNFVQLSFVKH